jgi:hypothetical protein
MCVKRYEWNQGTYVEICKYKIIRVSLRKKIGVKLSPDNPAHSCKRVTHNLKGNWISYQEDEILDSL